MPSGNKKNTNKKNTKKKNIKKKTQEKAVVSESKPAVKKGRAGLIALVLIAAVILTGVFMSVDYYTAWGNDEKLINRAMDAAEKNAIYKKYPEVLKKYNYIVGRWENDENYKEYVRQAKLGIAKAYKDSQQYIPAIEAYRALTAEYSTEKGDMYAWLMLELGECYNSILNTNDALKTYTEITRQFPDTDWSVEAIFGIADAYRNNGDSGKAMYYYNKIVEKYKKGFLSAEALTSIGKMYESDGDDKKALEIYSRVVKEYPEIVTEYAKMRQTVLNDRVKN